MPIQRRLRNSLIASLLIAHVLVGQTTSAAMPAERSASAPRSNAPKEVIDWLRGAAIPLRTTIPDADHARQQPPWASSATHSPLVPASHLPRPLQHALHPAVARTNLVLAPQLLVNVPQVQIELLVPVELQHSPHSPRHPFGRRLASVADQTTSEIRPPGIAPASIACVGR